MHLIGTRDSESAKEHRRSQVGYQEADMSAFPGLDIRDYGYLFSYGMTQVDHFDREDATSHLSQPSLVYLGTELGCFMIQIQQLPLVCEDNDTRVRAFFTGGPSEIWG
jgi:hypothetical protein